MKIKNLTLTENTVFGYSSNCYLLTSGGEAAVVDPSIETEIILEAVRNADAQLKYIILTHGHFDHMHVLDELRKSAADPVCIHTDDAAALTDSNISLFTYFGYPATTFSPADVLLKDGDELVLGDERIKVVHTPGHTPGCICLVCGDDILTGDTLFDMSVGRYDFPRSNGQDLRRSIEKLYSDYPNSKIYPGHGGVSTMQKQINENPWTRGLGGKSTL